MTKRATKQRTMVFESLGVGMLFWPGAPGGQVPRNHRANTEEAHRAQSAPRGTLRGEIRRNHLGEGLGKLGISRRLIIRKKVNSCVDTSTARPGFQPADELEGNAA